MEDVRMLYDVMKVCGVEPIWGMEKYTLGQGLNENQALEIKDLIACAVGVNLDNIPLDSELPPWGNPYWGFTFVYLLVIRLWGSIQDNYYDRPRGELWNVLNIQEKQMLALSMGVMYNCDIYKYKWTQ